MAYASKGYKSWECKVPGNQDTNIDTLPEWYRDCVASLHMTDMYDEDDKMHFECATCNREEIRTYK